MLFLLSGITDDAVNHIQKLAAEFMSVIISGIVIIITYQNYHYYDHHHYCYEGARDQCIYNDKKTIDYDDVLEAMLQMGLLDQRLCLSQYMSKYKETMVQPTQLSSSSTTTTILSKQIKEKKVKENKQTTGTSEKKRYYIKKKDRVNT